MQRVPINPLRHLLTQDGVTGPPKFMDSTAEPLPDRGQFEVRRRACAEHRENGVMLLAEPGNVSFGYGGVALSDGRRLRVNELPVGSAMLGSEVKQAHDPTSISPATMRRCLLMWEVMISATAFRCE